MKMTQISILDGVVIFGYISLLVFAGIWISRRNKTSNSSSSEELFLSGRSLPWYKVGLSIFSTNVSPSMLVAYFGAAYTSGMVLANFEWMAWVFLLLLSFLFIPHYLRNKISTMPEFLLRRFGDRSHAFFTYFSMFSSLVTWASFMLCIGGIVINQLLGIPIYISVIVIVLIALSYSSSGGLSSIVHTGMIQSVILLFISITILIIGLTRVGNLSTLVNGVPPEYWKIFRPASDDTYPWHAIVLGYPVIGIWFWCTEQSIVQRTLAAKNIWHGQMGAWLVAALKIIMPFLFILPGIICLVMVKNGQIQPLDSPDHAYITMVMNLLPAGLIGLALATLIVSIINDVATGIGAFSTIFAMDFYGKKLKPGAEVHDLSRIGKRASWIAGLLSAGIAMFFSNSDKGLFELGQSLCTYLAPPISTVFILGLLWKRATPKAAELTLYLGTLICLAIGFCQLINFPSKEAWPHFMLLCFYMMLGLMIFMVVVSLLTSAKDTFAVKENAPIDMIAEGLTSRGRFQVRILWSIVAIIMIILYCIFN
ncbi:MAG: sodium:solute symporter family transporter [Chitinophagia bacterium]|jgi:SSS family solute:Na+ symporter